MRRSWLIALSLQLAGALAAMAAEPAPSQRLFGVLQSDAARAESNYKAGVRLAVLSIAWDRYEPREGDFDAAYVAEVRKKMERFRSAGLELVLDPGMQYPPAWVRDLPGARYVNQYGEAYNEDQHPGAGGLNAVFSARVRAKQAAYLRNLRGQLGGDFYAVRLGWGYYGELNLPSARFGGRQNCYWAFDDCAQGRASGLPAGVAPCPVPGWQPGTASVNHESAKRFINWYLESLRNYHDWQIATARELYPGPLAMMYPSWGVRPGQLEAAIAQDLGGGTPAEKNGEVQRGFDFARFIDGITDANVIVYTTWIDSDPGFSEDTSTDPARWCPVHYLAELAGRHRSKLRVWGENTGRGDLAAMDRSFRRMRQYGLIGLVWAFEADLYDGSGRYATLADYQRRIDAEAARRESAGPGERAR